MADHLGCRRDVVGATGPVADLRMRRGPAEGDILGGIMKEVQFGAHGNKPHLLQAGHIWGYELGATSVSWGCAVPSQRADQVCPGHDADDALVFEDRNGIDVTIGHQGKQGAKRRCR